MTNDPIQNPKSRRSPNGGKIQNGEIQNPLSEPFSQIFIDRAEANWAFDLLCQTVQHLRARGAYDQRVAVTLTRSGGRPALHLNFGPWLVLGFRGPGGQSQERINLALLAERIAWDERFTSLSFDLKEGEPEIRVYKLPVTLVNPMPSALQQAYEEALEIIATRFQNWQKSNRSNYHRPEIIEACADPDKRERLFAGQLVDHELLYGRTFRPELEIAEEEELYGIEGERESVGVWEYGGEEIMRKQESKGAGEQGGVELQDTGEVKIVEPDETLQEFTEAEIDVTEPTLSTSPPDSSFTLARVSSRLHPSSFPPYPLPQLAQDTGFDETELTRWLRALERKGQIILYGPPGTGKTYVAERLARHLVGGTEGFIELVQFHPAYAYEDFIQGLRPRAVEGGLEYPLVPGRFLEFCRQAAGRQGPCVLIVDEINRADLARVFGELMYLLEYRDRAIPLAGGGQSFQIPANVRLIGTMNTADRSIALVDHALRRRFAFLPLRPNYDLLRHYHQREATGVEVEALIKVLQRLNRAIGDPHYEVGVTFFLTPTLAPDLEDIWRMEIEPYLEEYFFDQPTQVDAFRWSQVKSELSTSP